MKKLKFVIILFILLPSIALCQEITENFNLKTKTGIVIIPGIWQQLNTADDSGQTYLKNKEGIIIAVAQNPKKAYPFFNANKSDFENVKLFYTWDSAYMKEQKLKTDKLKENPDSEYIVWKYNDGKLDNVFLFGSSKTNFLNLLIYTNIWSEEEKIKFLEKLYSLNK
jgi:hypothetical protein